MTSQPATHVEPSAPVFRDPELRRRRLFWLVYLPVVLLEPALDRGPAQAWVVAVLAMAAFAVVFVRAVNGSRYGLPLLILVGNLLGLTLAPTNLGAVVFFAFAAGAAAHLRYRRAAGLAIVAMVAATAVESWVTGQALIVIVGGLLASCVGVLSYYVETSRRVTESLRHANAEIARLGAVAERERIARDLHDVLGHTLSLIAVKTELAARLADGRAPEAASESRDVLRASQTALAEIREVVRGYRAALSSEIGQSRTLLEAAEIKCTFDVPSRPFPEAMESIFAFALREAVTNVVRHANATECRVTVSRVQASEVLEIRDNGRGQTGSEGSGLRGMRERVSALGGMVTYSSDGGTTVRITVPYPAQ